MNDTVENVVSFLNVTKTFPLHFWNKKTALTEVSFKLSSGKTYGLLGANGSGKSTIFKLILGFIRPTKGDVMVLGGRAGIRGSREGLGYLPESARLPKFMTGHYLLSYFGKLQGLSNTELEKRIDQVLEMVSLSDARRERIGGYSKGMTQRLSIAQAILKIPKILILDEPMSGLDPLGRKQMRGLVQQLQVENPTLTILMSTHTMEDAISLCSDLILLKKGALVKRGKPAEFLRPGANELDPSIENMLFSEKRAS